MMRRRGLLCVLCCCVFAAAGSVARAGTGSTFIISGHGWGHGIGMSQYGALGYAQHGFDFSKIVAHYYPGTALGPAPVARVRVLLADGRSTLTVASDAPFTLRDGSGAVHKLDPGSYAFGPGLQLRLAAGDPALTALPGPLVFLPGATPLSFSGKQYRGQIQALVTGKSLSAINIVGLEAYLGGVVPSEMPYFWASEALKAQAVVARSYALAVRKPSGPFDLYGDTRSQVYGGIAAERAETNAAIAATAGQVLLYGGKVAVTYFFSTSGGRTAAVGDVWTNGRPVPYLVSVPDPYD
ncbi:MAG: SpoIID/LytB domain-containing protein, partial [Gaiellaceae bacterium]